MESLSSGLIFVILRRMKILFLTPDYLKLQCPVEDELKRQGHEVVRINDQVFRCDFRFPFKSLRRRLINRVKCACSFFFQRYWKKNYAAVLNDRYDLFLCINGTSFHPCVMKTLRKHNPDIRSVLYLWDDCSSYFDFVRYAHCFDSIKTYDLTDSRKLGFELLPFYWVSSENDCPNCYELSIVGTRHHDRLEVTQKVAAQFLEHGVPREKLFIHIQDSHMEETEYIKRSYLSPEEVWSITKQSRCILDTDRPSQTGTTPRLIWAMALGKKVITTNRNIVEMDFYNPKQVMVIDRENPVIDWSFVENDEESPMDDKLLRLRIDHWVERLLS